MSKPIPKGKEVTGDMTKALDSRFINAIVLRGALEQKKAQVLPLTIDRVEFHESLRYENGQVDKDAYLLYFQGTDKPLKLNTVNTKRIIDMHGTIGEGWHGKQIKLCIEQDRCPHLGGKKGPCVRVYVEMGGF